MKFRVDYNYAELAWQESSEIVEALDKKTAVLIVQERLDKAYEDYEVINSWEYTTSPPGKIIENRDAQLTRVCNRNVTHEFQRVMNDQTGVGLVVYIICEPCQEAIMERKNETRHSG